MSYQPFLPYGRVRADYTFDALQRRAKFNQLWSRLFQRPYELLSMNQLYQQTKGERQYHAGIQSVPLDQIRGSIGRSGDFDAEFRPLHSYNRERWINIAVAHHEGTPLPAVDLVRIDGVYFVMDGHHRISVARALGQVAIDARVVEWQNLAAVDGVDEKQRQAPVMITAPQLSPACG